MSTEMFDTLEAADALTRAGLAEPHARAIAATMRKAVSEGVATKGDVAEIKGELGAVKAQLGTVKAELKGDIGAVEAELKGNIGAVEAKLKGDIAAVKADMLALKWVLGFLFAMNLAMMARLFGVI